MTLVSPESNFYLIFYSVLSLGNIICKKITAISAVNIGRTEVPCGKARKL